MVFRKPRITILLITHKNCKRNNIWNLNRKAAVVLEFDFSIYFSWNKVFWMFLFDWVIWPLSFSQQGAIFYRYINSQLILSHAITFFILGFILIVFVLRVLRIIWSKKKLQRVPIFVYYSFTTLTWTTI